MEKGQLVEVRIEDMSGEGSGIGKADGFVVFVENAVIGDVVKARLVKVKKNYGFAELTELVEPSPEREYGFDCAAMAQGCGGCPYGSIGYGAQVSLKERQVREKLHRIAGIDEPAVRPIIGMEESDNGGLGPFRYRNKARFPISTGGVITRKGGIVEGLGEPSVGFFRAGSHEVVDCGDCFIQSAAAMAAADALRRFMKEDNITAWDPKWKKGLMRHMTVKTAFATGEVMVVLAINGNGIPNIQKLIEMLDDAVYEAGYSLESVVLSIEKYSGHSGAGKKDASTGGSRSEEDAVSAGRNVVAAGSPVIRDSIGGLDFEISPDSFYQVNPVQMKRLYDKVREYCGFGETARKPVILDLYCGVGSIGLYCADDAEAMIGIESVEAAVRDANRNAVINGIVNARYICGRAEEVLPLYARACDDTVSVKQTSHTSPYSLYTQTCDDTESLTSELNDFDHGKNPAAKHAGMKTDIKIDADIAALLKRADIAILDPPRAGCRPELLLAVAALGVDRIVYVSCDPATLARDIKLLGELGYRFVEATPCDMFPWSGHVETVCLLSNTQSKKKESYITLDVEMADYYRIKNEGKNSTT